MDLYTIGCSKKTLREFVSKIQKAGVNKVIDIRLNNTSQLAGYAKKKDLEYILELIGIAYEHRPDLAPNEQILNDYKKKKISWQEYESQFGKLLEQRQPRDIFGEDTEQKLCLLCAEVMPDQCHRRLVAEYYANNNEDIQIRHI